MRGGGQTWLMPPEFSVHMANLFASPTVSPSKSMPLSRKNVQRQVKPPGFLRLTSKADYSRDELGSVVLLPVQEIGLAPQQEVVQSLIRVPGDVNVVFYRPNLQTHQHNSNVERPIQLQAEEEETLLGLNQLPKHVANQDVYLIDVIYSSQNAVFGLASISRVLEEKRRQTSGSASDRKSSNGVKVTYSPQHCRPPQTARRTSVDLRQV